MPQGIFSNFDSSASGMAAQRRRLDAIAENLANSETTRTADGTPYRRKRVVMQEAGRVKRLMTRSRNFVDLVRSHLRHLTNTDKMQSRTEADVSGVAAVIEPDQSPFRLEFDPGHPDADERGYVQKPNVNVVEEMVDMISATRAYQANAAALEAAKDMFTESLRI